MTLARFLVSPVFLRCCLPLLVLTIFMATPPAAEVVRMDLDTMEARDVTVRFARPLAHAARDLIGSYGPVKAELERSLGRTVDFTPTVLLIRDRETFRKISGNDAIVALALPLHRTIIIDYSRMGIHPFTLEVTLKHELCHLLLHSRIRSGLPKWFEEGVAQWSTGGLAEIVTGKRRFSVSDAALSGRLLRLDDLKDGFPDDTESMLLAYEESKSITEFITGTYGPGKIREILDHMEEGEPFEQALSNVLPVTVRGLERQWRHSLGKRTSWFLFAAHNLYEILFFLMALITVYAFFALMVRKWIRAKHAAKEEE